MEKHGRCLRAAVLLQLMALLQVQPISASPVRRLLHDRAEATTTIENPPVRRHLPPTPRSIEGIAYTSVQPSASTEARDWQPSEAIAWQIADGQVQAYSVLQDYIPVTSTHTYTPLPRALTSHSGSNWAQWDGRPSGQPDEGGPPQDGRPDGSSGGARPQGYGPPDEGTPGFADPALLSSSALTAPVPFSTPTTPTSVPALGVSISTSAPAPGLATSTSVPASAVPTSPSVPVPTGTTSSPPVGPPVSSVPDSSLTSLSTSEVQTVTEAPPSSTSGVSFLAET